MRLGSRWRRPAPMSMSESVPPTRRVGRAMAWGVAIGVGAVVFRELVRPREQTARLIDWERVEQIALNRCGEAADLPGECGRARAALDRSAWAGDGLSRQTPVPGADGRRPPAVGAIQHSDLPSDVRAAGESPAADSRVADLELRPERHLPLSGPDVGIAGSAGPRPVRPRASWTRAGRDLVAHPGGAERSGLGAKGPLADRRAASVAGDARDDPCLGVQSTPLVAGIPGRAAETGP